jgi:hypothetical protein
MLKSSNQLNSDEETRFAKSVARMRELSPGDYQVMVSQAIEDKSLAEYLMYAEHSFDSKVINYEEDMEKGFDLIRRVSEGGLIL